LSDPFLIEEFDFGEKVHFYTIRREGAELSETDKFIRRFYDPEASTFSPGYGGDLQDILVWIEQIGQRGMGICSLKFENAASALPPKKVFVSDLQTARNPKLRLYCIVLPPSIIILCGGGIKTSQTSQEGSDTQRPFRQADQIGKKITEMITARELFHNDETKSLEGELEIWLT